MDDKTLENEFREVIENFAPDIKFENKQKVTDDFAALLVAFENVFTKSIYFEYLNNRPSGFDKAEYLSKVPDGIYEFENWLNGGLLDVTTDITNALKQMVPSDISNIYLAQLFDDHDFEKFYNQTKFNDDQKKAFQSIFESMFSQPELSFLLQSMACMNIGLFNAANSLMMLWIQSLWFDGEDILQIMNAAKAIAANNNKAKTDSKKSNDKRHAKHRAIKNYALKLYLDRSFPSVKNAAESITQDVMDYAHNSEDIKKLEGKEKRFPSIFSAARTIEKWIGEYKNLESKKNKL